MKKKLIRLSLILGLLFFIPFILSIVIPYQDVNDAYIVRGNYNSELTKLNSIQLLEKNVTVSPEESPRLWLEAVDSLLQFRFYHGTCRYNFNENWIAYLMGEYIWDDLRMIVIPDQILDKKVGVCNQINIVFQSMLENNNFRYRSVGLNHHLLTEVFYNDSWHVFDADYEPNFNGRPSMEEIFKNQTHFRQLYEATPGIYFNQHFNLLLESNQAVYYKENVKLANNLSLFHKITVFFSNYAWIILILIGLLLKYL